MSAQSDARMDEILELYDRLTEFYDDQGAIEEREDSRETLRGLLSRHATGEATGEDIAHVLGMIKTVMHRSLVVKSEADALFSTIRDFERAAERTRRDMAGMRDDMRDLHDQATMRRDEAFRALEGVEDRAGVVRDRSDEVHAALGRVDEAMDRLTRLHERAVDTLHRSNEHMVFTLNERRRYEIDHEKVLIHRNYLLMICAILAIAFLVVTGVFATVIAEKNTEIQRMRGD